MKKSHVEDGVLKIDLASPAEAGFIFCDPKKITKLKPSSVTLLSAAHVLEKIPREKFMKFMDDCWKALKVGGQMRIACYYAGSTPFWADPYHVNGLTIQSWSYFDPEYMGGKLYQKYKPKPWKIETIYVQTEATMEVLLSKRRK